MSAVGFDEYFDVRSRSFARHYGNKTVARALGRGALFTRLQFAADQAVETEARHVLDVGCGSGPLFEPLASRGIRVTGLEPAPGMLELANHEASRFPGLVEIRQGSWEDIDETDAYDLAVALGIFDYVSEPERLLATLGRAAGHVVASFPGRGLRTRFRDVRYRRGGVRVFGYTPDGLTALAASAGLEIAARRVLGRAGWAVRFQRPPG
jgi:2-polyprenyl-3-methyl-5-hydroxy-6-metoxy-1,4-benzoquinol methylase